jgi:hypothetical protein
MEVPMSNKSDNSRNSDVALLASWREWLTALEAEMSATNERDEKRRHVRVEAIQHSITETPSEGIEGIGVKLALANFLDGFDDGGESAVSAYLDTVRMLDRDFLAEAEAVIEREAMGPSAPSNAARCHRERLPRVAARINSTRDALKSSRPTSSTK